MRSSRRHRTSAGSSSASAIHERLYGLHHGQLERLKEQKKQFLESLSSQAGAPLREKAGIAMSPRSRSNAAPLGGSTPRPDLWLGSHAAAGPTTDKAMPASPRGSVAGRTSQAGASELGDEKPGPGAYNSTSDFKPADRLRKDPSKGSASSFQSKTKRLFDFDGAVIDTTLHPGKKLSDAPGVGTYPPADMGSIEKVAEALKRRAAKLAALRRNKDIKEPNRFQTGTVPPAATPGPGAYDADRLAKAKEERQYGAKFMAFKSGSRRALPWGGRGSDAPQSIRARKVDDLELADLEGPGPGEYEAPSKFAKPAPSARRRGTAWSKGAARFAPEPPIERIGPSAVHYTPNYSQCS